MLKRFNDFVNESNRPKEGASNSKFVKLTEDEVGLFSSEPVLGRLISDEKIALYDDKVWYLKNDKETKEILDQYLEM